MRRNLDTVGRIARGVSGVWLLAVALSALRAGRRPEAATAAVAGAGLLANAATGFCGGNVLFGIDTADGSPPCAGGGEA